MVSDTKIAVGDVVKIQNWFGVVLETHLDEAGNLSIIQVQTARNIFRGFGPEYIDVRLQPDAIQSAAQADLQAEIKKHQRLQKAALSRMLSSVQTIKPQLTAAD